MLQGRLLAGASVTIAGVMFVLSGLLCMLAALPLFFRDRFIK